MPFSLFHRGMLHNRASRASPVDAKRKETTLVDKAQLIEKCQPGEGCPPVAAQYV